MATNKADKKRKARQAKQAKARAFQRQLSAEKRTGDKIYHAEQKMQPADDFDYDAPRGLNMGRLIEALMPAADQQAEQKAQN